MSDILRQMPYSAGWHKVRQKPSGKFEARWADENGKARGKCFLTESQALRYAVDRAKEILDGVNGWGVVTKDLAAATTEFLSRYTDDGTLAIHERHLRVFAVAHPEIRMTGQLTKDVFEIYNVCLEKVGHNSGGRRHILKSLQTFTNFCREKNWLKTDPFFKFAWPKQEFEGRPLTPSEYAKMITIDPGHEDADIWISRALRIGNPSMLRISQVWKLTPEDFRAPDLLRVDGIKGQPGEWKPLHPTARAAILELMAITPAGHRFFAHWNTLDAMRKQLRRKAERVGLKGVRFHDAGKVTRVTELDAAGVGLGDLAALSNTSKATLAKHYIKADRRRAYAAYQTYGGPTDSLKIPEKVQLSQLDPATTEMQNSANLKEIDAIRR